MSQATTVHGGEEQSESAAAPAMSLCPLCGGPSYGADALCAHHVHAAGDWATGNRIMCDFIHRGIVSRTPAGSSLSHPD
jgi:hypothetical protein